MRQLVLSLAAIAIAMVTTAQKIHIGLFGGAAAYNGDLTEKLVSSKTMNPVIGLSFNYELGEQLMLRSGFSYTRLNAHDRNNSDSDAIKRNLSFETALLELSAGVEYYLINLNERKYSPYVFAGLALYRFNPYTYTTAGEQVYLRPLSTEGQGLAGYPGKYSLTQLAVPFGGGLKFAVNDNLRIGLELGIRKLFTDYLDDVSSYYADPADLFAARGQLSVDLSYRGDELPGGSPEPPAKGVQRGGEKKKDYYSFGGLHLTYRLGGEGGGGGGGGRHRNSTGCPKVY